MEINGFPLQWPNKYDLFGVGVSATNYEEAVNLGISAAQRGIPATVTALAVHGLITARREDFFRKQINTFDIVVPDGQPVRWALNSLFRTKLTDRVYGPELMLKLCSRASEVGIGIYLYGSYRDVVEKLRYKLMNWFPSLKIVGCEPSLFRPLTPEEDKDLITRINQSNAGFLFLGLGCPLQEIFAYEHRNTVKSVQVCVGAAFDFHAGNKKMAPKWMQKNGLEWLYRLGQEPRRLWRRYLVTNCIFMINFCLQFLRLRKSWA
jgi:N-acetylglucosaminyldiphosphoundecaprenol N-acetyl-beta-D-mannosaminyltransferase